MPAVLWILLVLLAGVLPRAIAFNHWIITEEGKIEYQVGGVVRVERAGICPWSATVRAVGLRMSLRIDSPSLVEQHRRKIM